MHVQRPTLIVTFTTAGTERGLSTNGGATSNMNWKVLRPKTRLVDHAMTFRGMNQSGLPVVATRNALIQADLMNSESTAFVKADAREN